MTKPLQTDAKGNIIVRPVLGWTTHRVAGIAVLLTVEYVETEEGLRTGYSQSVQLGLTAAMCQELADTLSKAAKGILGEGFPSDNPTQ